MIIKNPDKLLKQWIPATDGELWYVNDLNLTMDRSGISYIYNCICIYKMIANVPVKSSPNYKHVYNMNRRMEQAVTLRLFDSTYELHCNGEISHGYCKDIGTINKFISKVADILPKY
jgi:hypothetical protein